MNLNIFRRKLRFEVCEIEEYIEYGMSGFDNVQSNVYCIASLIRKIITRVPKYKGVSFKIFELGNRNNARSKPKNHINLEKLVNKILHYQRMSSGWISSASIRKLECIQILSDFDIDGGLTVREVMTKDFIRVAKEIATDHKSVLKSLLDYSMQSLKNTLDWYIKNPNPVDRDINYYLGIEASEALRDVFSLARRINLENLYNLPTGITDNKIKIFFEVLESRDENSRVVRRESYKMKYDDFISGAGNTWHFVLCEGNIKTYKCESEFKIKGETIIMLEIPIDIVRQEVFDGLDLYFKRGQGQVRCMILANDLLKVLDTLKNAY